MSQLRFQIGYVWDQLFLHEQDETVIWFVWAIFCLCVISHMAGFLLRIRRERRDKNRKHFADISGAY